MDDATEVLDDATAEFLTRIIPRMLFLFGDNPTFVTFISDVLMFGMLFDLGVLFFASILRYDLLLELFFDPFIFHVVLLWGISSSKSSNFISSLFEL